MYILYFKMNLPVFRNKNVCKIYNLKSVPVDVQESLGDVVIKVLMYHVSQLIPQKLIPQKNNGKCYDADSFAEFG